MDRNKKIMETKCYADKLVQSGQSVHFERPLVRCVWPKSRVATGKPAEGEEGPRQDVDLDRVSELLTNMLPGFEQFNPDAVEPYLRQIEALLPARQTAPIAKRVDAFDFTGAKAETLKLAAALGIDLEG